MGEVEKLTHDISELIALDASTRRQRQRHTFMGAWDDHIIDTPHGLDGLCSPVCQSPMLRNDLMQELREAAEWPRRKKTRDSLGESLASLDTVEEEDDSSVAMSTLAAVGTLKAQFLVDGFLLDRQTLLSKSFLALRLACGNMRVTLAGRSLTPQNPLTKAFVAYRSAVNYARDDRARCALAENLAAAACHARLSRRRR